MNLEVNFTTVQKELDLSFTVDTLWQCCLRLLADLKSTGATLSGLNVYGIEMKVTFNGGIELRGATSFDPTKNGSVTGYGDYFEVLMFTGPVLGCCGSPGRWQMGLYFQDDGALFGWGQTRFVLDFFLSSAIEVNLEYLTTSGGTWELKGGLGVSW
jgi:hypothetical protein